MTTLDKTTHDRMTNILNSKAGGFIWHLVQMILAMEAGMMVYHLLLRPILAPTGLSALTKEFPLIGYWLMVASMTLPMIVLMRCYHKSSWRYCMEMTIAMLTPLAALTIMVLCHLFPIQTLYGIGDPVMFLAMATYMLIRPHQHTHSGHEHADHQHARSVGAEISDRTVDKLDERGDVNQGKHACH